MPESTTPPGRIEVKRIGDIPIYLETATGRFEATIKRPGRYGATANQVITRKDLASVERELLKNMTARVEVIQKPRLKGRTSWRLRDDEVEYGPHHPLADVPDRTLIVTAEGGRREGGTAFRTEDGAFVQGPFARPNEAVTARLRTLRKRHDKEIADFEREWDTIIGDYETVSPEQLTAEIRASIVATKSGEQP